MKISLDEVDRILQSRAVGPAARPSNGKENGGAAPSPAADVDISEEAQEVVRLKRAIAELPEVREDLVNSLKERIQRGEYKVSGEEIAELMMRRAVADRIR